MITLSTYARKINRIIKIGTPINIANAVSDNITLLGSFSGMPVSNNTAIVIIKIDNTNVVKFFFIDLVFKFITYSPYC